MILVLVLSQNAVQQFAHHDACAGPHRHGETTEIGSVGHNTV